MSISSKDSGRYEPIIKQDQFLQSGASMAYLLQAAESSSMSATQAEQAIQMIAPYGADHAASGRCITFNQSLCGNLDAAAVDQYNAPADLDLSCLYAGKRITQHPSFGYLRSSAAQRTNAACTEHPFFSFV